MVARRMQNCRGVNPMIFIFPLGSWVKILSQKDSRAVRSENVIVSKWRTILEIRPVSLLLGHRGGSHTLKRLLVFEFGFEVSQVCFSCQHWEVWQLYVFEFGLFCSAYVGLFCSAFFWAFSSHFFLVVNIGIPTSPSPFKSFISQQN